MAGAGGFDAWVRELFADLGSVHVRKMFGGAGVYAQGVMFALIADDVVYLKTDTAMRGELAALGAAPFLWMRPSDGKAIDMGYWRLPEAASDDPDAAVVWGRRALAVALAVKAGAPRRASRARNR
jgi:DNA transformation protein